MHVRLYSFSYGTDRTADRCAAVSRRIYADISVRRGDLAGARRAYRRAVVLDPRDGLLATLAKDPASALPAKP